LARAVHFGGIDAGALGKCDQEILVSQNMLENAGEKVGFAGGAMPVAPIKPLSRLLSSAMKASA
jgi:hypothetical protein